jgi:hypothetical protein
MSEIKKQLIGGLDGDTNPKLLEPTKCLNLMNSRTATNIGGRNLRLESIKGTTGIAQSVYPPYGSSFVIGSCIDEARNRLIYFMWNSFDDHAIYCYDFTSGNTYAVLYDSQVIGGLNFSKSYRIDRNARVVGDLLYWTDNNNPPRRINIEAGIKMNHASYSTTVTRYEYPMNAAVITLHKKPPIRPLTIEKKLSTDVGLTLNVNQIKNNSFKFVYFYTYRDGEVSTLSIHSDAALYNFASETFDVIQINIPTTEIIDQDVQKVTVAVVYLGSGDTCFQIKTWDKSNATDAAAIASHNSGSVTALRYYFTNTEVGVAISPSVLFKAYDSVPRKSKTLENAGYRLFLGNNLSGYNTPVTTSLSAASSTSVSITKTFKSGSARKVSIIFYDKDLVNCFVVKSGSGLVTIPDRTYSTITSYVIDWTLSNADAINEIPDWAYYYAVVSTEDLVSSFFLQARASNVVYATKTSAGVYEFTKTQYLATNAGVAIRMDLLQGYGMGYTYQEGDIVKLWVVLGSSLSMVTLSVIGQEGDWVIAENYNLGETSPFTSALFEIYTPRTQSAAENFFERANLYTIANPTAANRTYSTTSGTLTGDVSLLSRTDFNSAVYTFGTANGGDPAFNRNDDGVATLGASFRNQKAADVNFQTGSSPLSGTAGWGGVTVNNDRWILKNVSATDFRVRAVGKISIYSLNDRTWSVYLEDSDENKTYLITNKEVKAFITYEESFDIELYLKAGSRLFILHEESDGTNNHYIYYRYSEMTLQVYTNTISYNVEAMSPNDKFWQKWITNAGRFQTTGTSGEKQLETAVRWSNTFIDETENNGLSSFEALNQKILTNDLGELNKLQLTSKVNNEQGIVMLGIGTNETVSMYLGEAQLYSNTGAADVVTTDSVIGTVNSLKGSYGTQNPESVIEYKGLVFWIDVLNGRVIQYSVNGLDVISNYGMKRFFQAYCRDYLQNNSNNIDNINGYHHFTTCINPETDEFMITMPALIYENYADTFPSFTSVPSYATSIVDRFDIYDQLNKTMSFKILENVWGSNYNYGGAEWMEYNKGRYVGWKTGTLYLMEDDSVDMNGFFGQNYPIRLCFVVNESPSALKNAVNIAWESSVQPNFTVVLTDTPNSQVTDLSDDQYESIEGVWFSQIFRDRISPNSSGTADEKIYTGDVLLGNPIYVMGEFQVSDTLIYIDYVNVGIDISRGMKQIIT